MYILHLRIPRREPGFLRVPAIQRGIPRDGEGIWVTGNNAPTADLPPGELVPVRAGRLHGNTALFDADRIRRGRRWTCARARPRRPAPVHQNGEGPVLSTDPGGGQRQRIGGDHLTPGSDGHILRGGKGIGICLAQERVSGIPAGKTVVLRRGIGEGDRVSLPVLPCTGDTAAGRGRHAGVGGLHAHQAGPHRLIHHLRPHQSPLDLRSAHVQSGDILHSQLQHDLTP